MKSHSRTGSRTRANAKSQEIDHATLNSSTATASSSSSQSPRLRILICSDFFYPRLGGVEGHQYQLAQCLIKRGHHVCIVTGTYEDGSENERNTITKTRRQGVRYVTNGLRVYYIPLIALHQQASLPNLFCSFPLLRNIILRERINLIHGHQSTSALAHEVLLHARTLSIPCVFTDHSLFSFGNAASINLNKVMKFTLTHVTRVICVSHCAKENLCLRAYLEPSKVAVIPNAVDTTKFRPEKGRAPDINERFTIIVLSRLVYRKGMDLIVDVIPKICSLFPNVHFLIGGDGPKRVLLEEMREKYELQERVEMIGSVLHSDVRDVLTRGHLFLNCSLTESFCIAILEAVSCGLYVVSTRVGGVPEILPQQVMSFAEPNPSDIIRVICAAIPHVLHIHRTNPDYAQEVHEMVRDTYNWHDVARRTENVYYQAKEEERERGRKEWRESGFEEVEQEEMEMENERRESTSIAASSTPSTTLTLSSDISSLFHFPTSRLTPYTSCGIFVGLLFALMLLMDHVWWRVLEWMQPREEIDLALDWKGAEREDQQGSESETRQTIKIRDAS